MPNDDSDLLQGAEEIRQFLDEDIGVKAKTTRTVFHICDKREIPFGKFNGQLIASKKAIRERLASVARGGDYLPSPPKAE